MHPPYLPVPRFYNERITIAILCGESMDLHWHDLASGQSYLARVWPQEIVEAGGAEWLHAHDETGAPLEIRLDMIRNFPTPVK